MPAKCSHLIPNMSNICESAHPARNCKGTHKDIADAITE